MTGDPHIWQAWRKDLRRGLGALAAGDFDGALAAFELAHQRAPGRPEVQVALGRERLRRGQLREAEALLAEAWRSEPSLIVAGASLARCLGVVGSRHAEAHAVLDAAMERHGQEPGLLVVRSEVYLAEARVDLAQDAAERALVAASAVPERRGKSRAAAAAMVAANLALSRTYNARGLELVRTGQHDQALFAFKRAVDLDPDWAAPVVNMGAAFLRLGRTARARSTWERALVLDADNVAARLNLADLARAAQDWDVAERGYRAALALDGTQQGIRRALALVLLERGAAAEAVELLAWERARAPGDALLCAQLGRAMIQAEQLPQAEAMLRAALVEAPDAAPIVSCLAQLLASKGQVLEAAELARRVLE